MKRLCPREDGILRRQRSGLASRLCNGQARYAAVKKSPRRQACHVGKDPFRSRRIMADLVRLAICYSGRGGAKRGEKQIFCLFRPRSLLVRVAYERNVRYFEFMTDLEYKMTKRKVTTCKKGLSETSCRQLRYCCLLTYIYMHITYIFRVTEVVASLLVRCHITFPFASYVLVIIRGYRWSQLREKQVTTPYHTLTARSIPPVRAIRWKRPALGSMASPGHKPTSLKLRLHPCRRLDILRPQSLFFR